MTLAVLALIVGLVVLMWSADKFVEGASASAKHLGMSPLLIGMLIVGFGTSAPEMVVSAIASFQGNPGLAIGNAYGSNIANIGLILGLTALISPIFVESKILKQELPFLSGITTLAIFLLMDGYLSRFDAILMLTIFFVFMGWSVWVGKSNSQDSLADEISAGKVTDRPLKLCIFDLLLGLVFLTLSSRGLVWGAIEIATHIGISDLVIGLTIVAVGTSLPELASSIAAIKRKENDIAIGNIIGSNLFNTMVVVGIAGSIAPFGIPAYVVQRDMLIMGLMTVSLFIFGYGFRGPGKINRIEGAILLISYLAYTTILILVSLPSEKS